MAYQIIDRRPVVVAGPCEPAAMIMISHLDVGQLG